MSQARAPGLLTLVPRIAAYARPHRARMSGGLAITAIGIALDLAKPLPLAIVLDSILSDKSPPWPVTSWFEDWSPLGQASFAAAAIVLIAVGRGLATLGANHLTIDVGQRMVNDLRIGLYTHLQGLSLRFHARQQTDDLLFRVMADTSSVQSLVVNGVLPLLSTAVMVAGMFAVMVRYDGLVALVALVVCPPLYLAVRWLTARISGHATASTMAESELYRRAGSALGAVKLVQAYGREERVVQDFRTGSERSLALSLRLHGSETLFLLVVQSLLAVGTAAIVWFGALRAMTGTLTIGELTVFLSYLRDLYQPVQDVSRNVAEIRSARAGLERVFSVLDVEPDVRDAPDAVPLPSIKGEIRFENVSFEYDDGRPVLRDVDLRIAPGEHVALVGSPGAGKSTLAGLILRFFDPQRGRVTVDGHDVRHVTLASLRRQVTMMLQEPIFFHATAFENIAWGSRDPDPARVRDAARRTEAEPFILALPGGYDVVLGEDSSTLSGSQRQRLALARALVRDTPIAILDEPTSALDAATEAKVWQNVQEQLRAHTMLVIARRLSTARCADRIVVLEDGAIVEQGTHEELLARRGAYFQIWHQPDAELAGAAGAGRRMKPRPIRPRGGSETGRGSLKFLIIQADDFGYGHGVNRGIVELADLGVVTAAGLMVNTPGTAEAVRLAAERPSLSLGLHVNFTNEAGRLVEFDDPETCRRELRRQFERFVELTGRLPTHLNSHQHVHRRAACQPSFLDLAEEYGLPLRDRPPVTFKGGFYGQWQYGVSEPARVSLDALMHILGTEFTRGVYELGVHPGYHDPEANYVYDHDRELERQTLGDARLPGLLRDVGVRLISYDQLGAAVAELARGRSASHASAVERVHK